MKDDSSQPYVSDAPVSDPQKDRFRRWPFARRIADTIAIRTDPSSFVVAIYGAWGDGKTTVLNFVDGELRKRSDVLVVRFNPWRFPDETALLRHFFGELARVLGESLTTGKVKLGQTLAKYGELLDVAWSGVGKATSTAGKLLSTLDIEQEKQKIAEMLGKHRKRVVVLMDDIDRLEKNEIQALFRLVKLSADFDHTAYVLAFDAEMVASAIGERFTSEEGKRSQAGRSFLEKIVQVPLTLPAIPATELRSFCIEAINEALKVAELDIDESEGRRFVRQFERSVEIRLKTPRMAKRYGNALAFSLAINRGEVNTVDMMLIEAIRVFYPEAFALVRHQKEIMLGTETTAQEAELARRTNHFLETVVSGLSPDEGSALKKLLDHLFPRMGVTRYGGPEQEFAKQQRIASEEYFDRYFTYSVPTSDVSDIAIRSFVEEAETSSIAETGASILQMVTTQNAGAVISKLRGRAGHISALAAEKLALAIAPNGDLFPNPESLFPTQPFSQAGILIQNLLMQIPQSNRFGVASKIIEKGEPITFAMEILKWIVSYDDVKPDERPLSKEQDSALRKDLAGRVGRKFKTFAPNDFPAGMKGLGSLLLLWASDGEPGETRTFLTKLIETKHEVAIPIIQSFLPTSFSVAGAHLAAFDRETYDRICRLIDCTVLFSVLSSVFQGKLDASLYRGQKEVPIDLRIANQFAYIHNEVLSQAKARQPRK
jgi:hypothetical protein